MAPSATPVFEASSVEQSHAKKTTDAMSAMAHRGKALPGIPRFASAENKRQWQLEHMACAFRVFAREGYAEGISGHISVRDPEFPDQFWINPLGVRRVTIHSASRRFCMLTHFRRYTSEC